jgi:hypothetical protein
MVFFSYDLEKPWFHKTMFFHENKETFIPRTASLHSTRPAGKRDDARCSTTKKQKIEI